jgi:hypothetical protein
MSSGLKIKSSLHQSGMVIKPYLQLLEATSSANGGAEGIYTTLGIKYYRDRILKNIKIIK